MSSLLFARQPELLHLDKLSDDEVRRLLEPVGFADWNAAARLLRALLYDPENGPAFNACLPDLLIALRGCGMPDRALASFERLVRTAAEPTQLLHYLADNTRAVETLVTLFAGSQYLTDIVLRSPEAQAWLTNRQTLTALKTAAQFNKEARATVASAAGIEAKLDALRRFQHAELLRIGLADLLGLLDMSTIAQQLSHLADSLICATLLLAAEQTGVASDGLVILGMGKLGGEELNYSSDIDLLFIARRGATSYVRLGECLIDMLSRSTSEGFLYRVDMRLRPWGRGGPLVSTLAGHIAYLANHARLWEKQALLKARVVAGDHSVGIEFFERAMPILFSLDSERVRADVRAMKQQTEAFLRNHGRDWGEVKHGEGSIRDVEFVAQYLQLAHGRQHPEVLSRNTLDALWRLYTQGFLAPDEYRALSEGYIFLRTIEHYLQMMDYRQTHSLPQEPIALRQLAHRLAFEGLDAGERLVLRYQQHSAAIRAVYRRYLEAEGMENFAKNDSSNGTASSPAGPGRFADHSERMPPSYAARFTPEEIERHAELAARLDDNNLVEVDAAPLEEGKWRVTIVAYDFFGELTIICGLLFAYGFNIVDGDIFTYEPQEVPATQPARRAAGWQRPPPAKVPLGDARQKIVDVFTVGSVLGEVTSDLWPRYAADLAMLLRRLRAGQQREAQGELARRVALALNKIPGRKTVLYPVDIEIDNDSSPRYTVMRIDAPDTIGFLYEFTNALALNGVYIARMTVGSVGTRVHDVLYVTDTHGQKITSLERQRELRAATVLVKHFTHLLPLSPNPETALLHFGEFLGQLFQNPNWPGEIASLERPEVLHALARLLGVSEFLWDDFLRMQYSNLFPVVKDLEALAKKKTKEMLQAELDAAIAAAVDPAEKRAALNAFKDREMFRIDMRHIQGHIPRFGQFSAELTDLAEVVVDAAHRLCYEELVAEHGTPLLDNGQPCPLAVCGLGKVGGRELGFASDIELMFIYVGNGKTSGAKNITTAEFYERLVQAFLRTILARQEGIFQIDLRLRPYGKAGSMAVSLEAFRRYFAPSGPAWAYERQALIKLRPIAGDATLGKQVTALRDELVYMGGPVDTAAMRGMRERQVRHLVAGGTINAKYSPGGLVDLEYLVQGLQLNYGREHPAVRVTNTREAMTALAAAGIIPQDDFTRLRDAHRFLRKLIDALRVVRGNAKDLTVPPTESEEFEFLARRLGYSGDVNRLRTDLTRHMATVQELSSKLLST